MGFLVSTELRSNILAGYLIFGFFCLKCGLHDGDITYLVFFLAVMLVNTVIILGGSKTSAVGISVSLGCSSAVSDGVIDVGGSGLHEGGVTL